MSQSHSLSLRKERTRSHADDLSSCSSDHCQPYTKADGEKAQSPRTTSTSSTSSESHPLTTLLPTSDRSREISDRSLIPHSRSSGLDTVSPPSDIRAIVVKPTEQFIRTP